MISMANDLASSGGGAPCEWSMTVFELVLFLAVFRAKHPPRLDTLCETLSDWFECLVPLQAMQATAANMVRRGWLAATGDRLHPTEEGRRAARPLVNGLIRMLDQGTRLIDVALMMSVLRLTKGELDE